MTEIRENWKTKDQAGVPSVKLDSWSTQFYWMDVGVMHMCNVGLWRTSPWDPLCCPWQPHPHCQCWVQSSTSLRCGHRLFPEAPSLTWTTSGSALSAACQAGLQHPCPSSPSFSQYFLVVASTLLCFLFPWRAKWTQWNTSTFLNNIEKSMKT